MNLPIRYLAAILVCGAMLAPAVQARKSKSIVQQAVEAYQSTNSTTLPAAGTIEVAFSPNEGSEHLVVKVIDSARTELDLLTPAIRRRIPRLGSRSDLGEQVGERHALGA